MKDWKKNPPRKWSRKEKQEVDVMELTLLVPYYVSTQSIGGLSPKMMTKVLDTDVAQWLDQHVGAHNNDHERALTDDGLNLLNDKRRMKSRLPLKRVRIKKHDTPIWDTDGHRRLKRPTSPNERLHIKMGDNYALAVHVNETTGERSFDIVSFYDAVQRKREGRELIDPKPGHRTFLLRKKDPVYVPRPGEEVRNIPWHDQQAIWDRVYVTVKFSGNEHYFIHASVSAIAQGFEAKEFGSQNCTVFIDSDDPRTKISFRAIPVRVDRLGRVSPLWP